MSSGFAVFILMNNYFHDVATAMLLACSAALWAILRSYEQNREAGAYLAKLASGIDRIAWFSIAWIIISGIPRALTFHTFEWANAVEKHHEAGLIVKYMIAVFIMIAGACLWFRFSKEVRKIVKASH